MNFGVEERHSPFARRKIRTVNFLNLVVAFFFLAGFITYLAIDVRAGFLPASAFFIMHVLGLFLSRLHKTRMAFLMFTLSINASILFINQYYPTSAGAYLYYFPLIVSVLLLNNPSFKDRHTLLHLGLCTVFFIANLLMDFPELRLQLAPDKIEAIWHYNLIISALCTGILCLLLSQLIERQNREIISQNQNLTAAQQAVTNTLREKEILLAELHHRVKNNLAIISGLLNLQGDATTNVEARQIISDSKNRILSMALVHRMLFENPNLKNINVGRYSNELIRELLYAYNLQKSVELVEEYDDLVLPVSKSIPLGLILNEIVTNSIKYAFRSGTGQGGTFRITIRKQGTGRVILTAQDSGKGFPKDYNFSSPSLSLGIFLIKTLAEQIDGTVRFSSDRGARIELEFLHH